MLGDFVQCLTCDASFKPTVLSLPTTESLQKNLLMAMREAVVSVLDPSPTPSEMQDALAVLSAFADVEWHEEAQHA